MALVQCIPLWIPLDPLNPPPHPADQNTNLHYPFWTPGNKNGHRRRFSMQKCIKSQNYTIHFWPSENLLETLEKKICRETLKSEVFRKSILTPHPLPRPPWGSDRAHLWNQSLNIKDLINYKMFLTQENKSAILSYRECIYNNITSKFR